MELAADNSPGETLSILGDFVLFDFVGGRVLFVIFILLSELLRVSIHMFCIVRDVEVFGAKLFFSIFFQLKSS